jgi:HEAT repeat protein
MKTSLVKSLLLGSLLAFAASHLRAAEEADLIAILQSNSGAPEKWAACQKLRMIGTANAVPALAALLTDERLSQAARHTLEGLPVPEAGTALRDALGRTSGALKAGVIESLGWRAEAASVSSIKPSLTDADPIIAAAAAAALGRIGGAEAVVALNAAHNEVPESVKPFVRESLLKCAERFVAAQNNTAAAEIYRGLFNEKVPVQIRVAAWRGLVLSERQQRTERVVQALSGTDPVLQFAGLKVLRELNDRDVIQACVGQWASFPPESQHAVLDAQMKLGADALPTARKASQSPDVTLRIAAWQALGELNDTASAPALPKAAAGTDAAEAEAARESLARLRGPGAREALVSALGTTDAAAKAELLRAFGERGDREAVNLLLQNAASDVQLVQVAALDSLRRLAPPQAIAPLMDIAAKAKSDEQRDPVLKALYAVCVASPNKEDAARSVVQSLQRFPPSERRQILPLLSELATSDALSAAEAASRDSDAELAKEGVRVLTQWPNAAPAEYLLRLAHSSTEPTLQTLALRGAIEVVGQEPSPAKRLALLKDAFSGANRVDEKKQALGQIGQVPTYQALDLALAEISDPALSNEACLAAITIAEKLARSNPKLGDEVAAKVLAQVKEGEVVRRAWALRLKPSSGASFIRDWVVCGPYREPGIVGAQAVFNIAFGPEKKGQRVEWQTVPPTDHVNLAALFPGAENCVAYLKTHVLVNQECSGTLLMGSDDGIKAWLNGVVVHSHNVDRGEVPDQDAAPIHLKKGANELMLKITQGGGGWSASARIVGNEAKPIFGLMIERPTE